MKSNIKEILPCNTGAFGVRDVIAWFFLPPPKGYFYMLHILRR